MTDESAFRQPPRVDPGCPLRKNVTIHQKRSQRRWCRPPLKLPFVDSVVPVDQMLVFLRGGGRRGDPKIKKGVKALSLLLDCQITNSESFPTSLYYCNSLSFIFRSIVTSTGTYRNLATLNYHHHHQNLASYHSPGTQQPAVLWPTLRMYQRPTRQESQRNILFR